MSRIKQIVFPDKIRELNNEEQIKLATLAGEYGNCSNTGGETMNVGKFSDRLTIGKMIEILGDKFQFMQTNNVDTWWVYIEGTKNVFRKEQCVDALWEAIKYVLREEEHGNINRQRNKEKIK